MHTFFSNDISQWKMFQPIKGIFLPAEIAGYDGAMVLSLVVGILHLCLAMIVKTYIATRNNGFLESLGTWGWTLLIVGGVIVAGIALAGVIDASVTKWIVIALGVVSALGIFVFNNIHRNPLVNIGSGLWDTYNTATGLLGDVLSYLRLYALGDGPRRRALHRSLDRIHRHRRHRTYPEHSDVRPRRLRPPAATQLPGVLQELRIRRLGAQFQPFEIISNNK